MSNLSHDAMKNSDLLKTGLNNIIKTDTLQSYQTYVYRIVTHMLLYQISRLQKKEAVFNRPVLYTSDVYAHA